MLLSTCTKLVLGLILVLIIANSVSGAVIYVNEDGWWFEGEEVHESTTPISDAVNAASDGDVIILKEGNYEENVDVGVSVVIRSEDEAKSCIVARSKNKNIFEINAEGVEINGVSVEGSHKAGIRVNENNCRVINCTIKKCNTGIYVRGTSTDPAKNIEIANNEISNCDTGIKISGKGSQCDVKFNKISNCNIYGIMVTYSDGNEICGNTISNNFHGIYLQNADENLISFNLILENNYGIYLSDRGGRSENNLINLNNIIRNGEYWEEEGSYKWELYNNQSITVDAKHNYWAISSRNALDASIFDDEEGKGKVEFEPFLIEPANAPVPELSTLILLCSGIVFLRLFYRFT